MFFISVYLIRSSVIRVIEFTFWGNNIVRFLAKIEYKESIVFGECIMPAPQNVPKLSESF